MFCAVYLEKFPEKHTDLMVYGKMILREALRHKGNGWLVYDTCFRQQMETDPSNFVMGETE